MKARPVFEYGKGGREREGRLQQSIQLTLERLGMNVDQKAKEGRGRSGSRGRPAKPNKFWADSRGKTLENGGDE